MKTKAQLWSNFRDLDLLFVARKRERELLQAGKSNVYLQAVLSVVLICGTLIGLFIVGTIGIIQQHF